MARTTVNAPSPAPTVITDAYVSERQRFVFVFMPDIEEPLRFRHLDSALDHIASYGWTRCDLETESWSCQLYLASARTEPARHPLPLRDTLTPKR